MTELPPADWHVDPEDPAQYRYWDGSRWTDHRSPRYGTPDGEAGSSGDVAASRRRSIRDLLGGTWRLMTQNLRPLLVIYAVVTVVYLAGEEAVRRGYGDVFGDTLGALIDEVAAADPDADEEEFNALLEDRWNDVTGRMAGLGSSTLAAGILMMAVGAVVVVAINIVEFAAFGQVATARLGHREMDASGALRAGLKRLLRIAGVGLMLMVMFCGALMVVSLVAGLVSLVSGALAVVLGAVMFLVVIGVAAPLALLTLMTAAVGPAEPSMRYARALLRSAFWATLGRMALILVLALTATVPVLVVAELLGLFNGALARVALVGLGVFPEMLSTIAFFTVYHDLGGRHADAAEPSASSAS